MELNCSSTRIASTLLALGCLFDKDRVTCRCWGGWDHRASPSIRVGGMGTRQGPFTILGMLAWVQFDPLCGICGRKDTDTELTLIRQSIKELVRTVITIILLSVVGQGFALAQLAKEKRQIGARPVIIAILCALMSI